MKYIVPFLLAALVLIVAACAPSAGSEPPEDTFPIYFLAPTNIVKGRDALQVSYEQLSLPEGLSAAETAAAVVERLLSGSQDGILLSPFPEDVTLLTLKILDKRAYVDLSGSFARMDGIALTLADYCLTLSLTAIDGIESVMVTVEGRALAQQPRQVFRERDIFLSTEDSVLQLVEVSLYFLDETGALTAEQRTLEIYEGETRSANLIAALLEGPANSSLTSPFPDGFHISSVKVEDGVCRLNLPSSSLTSLPDDPQAQKDILLSLAQSLYSLDSIRNIRFLADGSELSRFGSIPISDLIDRPQD